MKVYKISKFWQKTSYVLFPLVLIPFLFLLIVPFIPEAKKSIGDDIYYWYILPMSLVMIFCLWVAFFNTIKGEFIIDKDKVYTKALFYNRLLYFNEIKGYRKTDNFTFIESKNNLKTIKISGYYHNGHEIIHWLQSNFKNLDEIEMREEKQEILNNYEYGWSINERENKFNKAKKISKTLNWIGIIIAIISLLLINKIKYIILLCVLYPIVILLMIKFYKGLIKIDDRKKTKNPSVFFGVFLTIIVLFLRGLVYYKIFDYTNVWLPVILITFMFLFILMLNNKGYIFYKSEKLATILTLSIFLIFGYGFGTVININCVLDDSKPETFKTKILKKWINKGNTTSYNLVLEKWNNQKESKSVNVTMEFYEKVKIKDTVTIQFMKGKLNIPWYEIQQDR